MRINLAPVHYSRLQVDVTIQIGDKTAGTQRFDYGEDRSKNCNDQFDNLTNWSLLYRSNWPSELCAHICSAKYVFKTIAINC